jgi:hypothetical protein
MKKKSVGLLELETAVLECFLEKTPLSPLGVNHPKSRHLSSIVNERFVNAFRLYVLKLRYFLVVEFC